MAGRRVALKAVDWLAFAELVPPNQRGMFNALKTRSDAIAAKLVVHQFVDNRFLVMFMSRWKFLTAGCFTSQSHVNTEQKFFPACQSLTMLL